MSKILSDNVPPVTGGRRFPGGKSALSGSVAALLVLLCSPRFVEALPEGGTVVAGQATLAVANKTLSVTAGDRSILNFTKFNIAADEHVRFLQPSVSSRVLARATDGTPSEIFGKLSANGQLVLANEAGIYFRGGSSISVGGLIAAAGRVSESDFLGSTGKLNIELTGTVSQEGLIEAGAHVVLAGLSVENSGTIVAPSGTVILHAGASVVAVEQDSDIYVVDDLNRDLKPEVSATGERTMGTRSAELTSVASRLAAPQKVGVAQNGKISARAVSLSAGDIYSVGVRHAGRTVAKNVSIVTPAKIEVSGEIEAPGGGSIAVRGEQAVELVAASIKATGEEGGGSVSIGGKSVSVDANSVLDVSGIGSGPGGGVYIGGDTVAVDGKLLAMGGAGGGNGGYIGVFAQSELQLGSAFQADVTAPHGTVGNLQIDDPKFRPVSEDVGVPLSQDGSEQSGTVAGEIQLGGASLTLVNPGGGFSMGDGLLLSGGAGDAQGDPRLVGDSAGFSGGAGVLQTGGGVLTITTTPGIGFLGGEGGVSSGGGVEDSRNLALSGEGGLIQVGAGVLQLGGGPLVLGGDPRTYRNNTGVSSGNLNEANLPVTSSSALNGGVLVFNRERQRVYSLEGMRLSSQAVGNVLLDGNPAAAERVQPAGGIREGVLEREVVRVGPAFGVLVPGRADPVHLDLTASSVRGLTVATDILGADIFRGAQNALKASSGGGSGKTPSENTDPDRQ